MPIINGESYPDYVYQPYPKWITLPDGTAVIVEDEHEHYQKLGTDSPSQIEAEDTATEFLHVDALDGVIVPEMTGEEVDPVCALEDAADADNTPIEAITAPDGQIVSDDIEVLRERADRLGLIYDKRWGAVKLQQAIEGAGARGALNVE